VGVNLSDMATGNGQQQHVSADVTVGMADSYHLRQTGARDAYVTRWRHFAYCWIVTCVSKNDIIARHQFLFCLRLIRLMQIC